MILIKKPQRIVKEDKYYIQCVIDDNNVEKKVYFGGVQEEYKDFLLWERSDAFVFGLLSYAMRSGQDITCEAPVSEELLYNLRQYLIPLVTKYGNNLYPVKIYADMENDRLPCAGYVGASASCGVDSFNTIHNQLHSEYESMNITHLCLNDVGAYNECYGTSDKQRFIKKYRYQRGEEMARELGLPIIKTESNFAIEFPQNHLLTNTYSSMFAVLCMRKAWRVYYYSSAFHDIGLFSLFNNESKDTSYYDLLSLSCISTDGLKVYSEGGDRTRLGKVMSIVEFEPAKKYLHVCINKEQNCGICEKCKRTLLCIDIAGKLEEFRNVFDIEYYKAHRRDYLEWIYLQYLASPLENEDMYNKLKEDDDFKKIVEEFRLLKNKIATEKIVLCGYGDRGQRLNQKLNNIYDKEPVAIVDKRKIESYVISYDDLKRFKNEKMLCLITPDKFYEEVRENIEKDYKEFAIVPKYQIDLLLNEG